MREPQPARTNPDGFETEPGRWCPQCRTHYRPDVTVCADCGTLLVDTPPQLPSTTSPSVRAQAKAFLTRLAGIRGLPPSFIERLLAAPTARWHSVVAFLAGFILVPVRAVGPSYVFSLITLQYNDAPPGGLRWVLGATGCLGYALAGYVVGSIQRRLGWLLAVGAIATVWLTGSAYDLRAGRSERLDWIWYPDYVALALGFLAVSAVAAWVAGRATAPRSRAAALCLALGMLWAVELRASWLMHARWLDVPGAEHWWEMWWQYGRPVSEAMSVSLAAIGVGWLMRRDGWVWGTAVGILAFASNAMRPGAIEPPALLFVVELLAGMAGGVLGQELVADFVTWRMRGRGVAPVFVMGAALAMGLSVLVGLIAGRLLTVAGIVVPVTARPGWLDYAVYFAGTALFGGVVGRLISRSARFAAYVAAGAVALRYIIFQGMTNGLDAASAAAGMALAAAAAFALASVYARKTAESERAEAQSEGVAGEVEPPES